MSKLKTTTALVRNILEHDTKARNSDSYLYLKVLQNIADREGIDLSKITVPVFLSEDSVFPPFESVRRSRQKIQATYPELAASDKVRAGRKENEAEYFRYATSEV